MLKLVEQPCNSVTDISEPSTSEATANGELSRFFSTFLSDVCEISESKAVIDEQAETKFIEIHTRAIPTAKRRKNSKKKKKSTGKKIESDYSSCEEFTGVCPKINCKKKKKSRK